MEDPDTTESISKAEGGLNDPKEAVTTEYQEGSKGKVKEMATPEEQSVTGANFVGTKIKPYTFDQKNTTEKGGDLYRQTPKGNTRAGAAQPGAQQTIKIVNGQYWHRHPGYLSGAKTLEEAEWHPASQRHRGKNGQDITEKLHVAGGLGKNGLLGAPQMGVKEAFMADLTSGGRAVGLLGTLADLGFSTAERQAGALFGLADAMLKGNPLSVSSGIIGQATKAFKGFADDLDEAREKYMIPEDVSQSALMNTIMGRAYSGRKAAYEKAYGSEARASDDLLDLAVDKSIEMKDGGSFFDTYSAGIEYKEGDDYNEYVHRLMDAKEKWLGDFKGMVNGEDYDLVRRDAVQNMNEGTLQMYSKSLYERNRDFAKAMDDLVQRNTWYDIDENGRIDFSMPHRHHVSELTPEQLDEYKKRLQIGSSMTSEQLQTIADRTKGLQRRMKTELANKRRYETEVRRREKEITAARMQHIKDHGTMAQVAVAEGGENIEIDDQHDPRTKGQLEAASGRLMDLLDENGRRRQAAMDKGVTSEEDLRARGIFTEDQEEEAKVVLDRWQDKLARLRANNKEATDAARSRRFLDMGAVAGLVEENFKKTDSKGIPTTYEGCGKMTNLIRNGMTDWYADDDNRKAADAVMDGYLADIASRAGVDKDDLRTALEGKSENNRMLNMLKDVSMAEASIADGDDANNTYADYLNMKNVSDAKRVLYGISLEYNSKEKKASAFNSRLFDSCYRALNAQIGQMADGCKEATKMGQIYDPDNVDILAENLDMFRSAISKGDNRFSTSMFKIPDKGFAAVKPLDEFRNELMDRAAKAASDAEFYAPSKEGDFLLEGMLGGGTTASQSRNMQSILSMMGLNEGLNRKVDEGNLVNRYMAMLGAKMGNGRGGVDPFSYSARTEDDRDFMLKTLKAETAAYDSYLETHPGDSDLAYAMGRHMEHLTEKIAMAEMRMAGGLSDTEMKVLDDYEAASDRELRMDLVNSVTNGSMDEGRLKEIKGAYLGDAPNPADYSSIRSTAIMNLRKAMDKTCGYQEDMNEIANAIGNDFGKKFGSRDEYLVSKNALDSFLGIAGSTTPMDRDHILESTGFDIDSRMDHMLIATFKNVGLSSLEEMESMSEDDLRHLYKALDKKKSKYIQNKDGAYNNRQSDILAKSCIVAQDMVKMYSARAYAWDRIKQRSPAWLTDQSLDPATRFDQANFEESFKGTYRDVFANVKRTRWTFSNIDELSVRANRDRSDLEFTKEDADALAGLSYLCAAYGLDPSGGQGVIDPTKVAAERKNYIEHALSSGTKARDIISHMGTLDEQMKRNERSTTTMDGTDKVFLTENNVIVTLSGGSNAYVTGQNPDVKSTVLPMNAYMIAKDIITHGRGSSGSRVYDALAEFDRKHTGLEMSLENIRRLYDNDNIVDALGLINHTSIEYEDEDKQSENSSSSNVFILPIVEDPNTGQREILYTAEYLMRFGGINSMDLDDRKTGTLKGLLDNTYKMNGLDINSSGVAMPQILEPRRDERFTASASAPRPWSDESIAKAASCRAPMMYLLKGRQTLENAYELDTVGGRIIENLPYVAGTKGTDVYVMANRTADAVLYRSDGSVKYISRRFGDIECRKFRQTLAGVDVMVTMPWALVDRTPPCLFYGLLDVYVPWAADGFQDPRVVAQTAKTRASFEEAAEAAALIRDFGGFDDSPEIDADPVSRKIRNIIMRAYAKVGAFGKWVFDQARSKAQTMPRITMDSYYTVLSAAYQLAKDITLGPCTSHGAWHLIKGIRSNALLALSANPFMQYRRKYASPRPEVDAIAYIGRDARSGERELHVKDMMMLIGLMSACEQIRLWPLIPRFYEDPSPEWKDAADYWYIMLHHPSPPGTYGEQVEEVGSPSEPAMEDDREGQDAGP